MIQQAQFFVAWLQAKYGIELSTERQEGQGLVEYALIIVLVSVVAFAALKTLGGTVTGIFTDINGKLSGS